MSARAFGGAVVAGLLLASTEVPRAAAGPGTGRIEVGVSGSAFLSGDRSDYYGGGGGDFVAGPGASLGLVVSLSSTFETALRVEYSSKRFDVDVAGPGGGSSTQFTDHWDADALGYTLVGTTRFPSTAGTWLGGVAFASLGVGAYTLVGASYSTSLASGEVTLEGTDWGGFVESGIEYPWPRAVPLSLTLGFRYARIEPVDMSGDLAGAPVTGHLPNDDGSDAAIDHSAVYLRLSTRFRVWGAAAETSSAPKP